MPTKPTVKVSPEVLAVVFEDFNLWAKIEDGRLLSTIVSAKDSPARHYPDATSRIVKHLIPRGRHIATTHRIEDSNGNILHQDAKDFHFPGLILTRP